MKIYGGYQPTALANRTVPKTPPGPENTIEAEFIDTIYDFPEEISKDMIKLVTTNGTKLSGYYGSQRVTETHWMLANNEYIICYLPDDTESISVIVSVLAYK